MAGKRGQIMGRHERPRGARPHRDPRLRPRSGSAPLILAGAIVISYAVVRASGATTLMFAPPARPPAAMPGTHPPREGASSPAHRQATPGSEAGQADTGRAFAFVACQFTSGTACESPAVPPARSIAGQAPGTRDGAGVTCSWLNHIECALVSHIPDLHGFSSWQCQG